MSFPDIQLEKKTGMTKTFITVSMAALMGLSVVACDSMGGPKQTGGALLGGIGGAVAGAQFGQGSGQIAAAAVGTLLGALVGSEVGRSLDKADMTYANQANQQAQSAPIGQNIQWSNPQSGNYGTITPVREGTDSSTGAYCREFQQTVTIGGKAESAYGTACRQPDGTWKVVDQR
ncbi:MAG TPA: RT0821/Lpp0805 family surface protein [Alphaproteobacteria bacterium]|jgi:surface antigen